MSDMNLKLRDFGKLITIVFFAIVLSFIAGFVAGTFVWYFA